jgi:hypothetical protein
VRFVDKAEIDSQMATRPTRAIRLFAMR